jgi:hypothetical protein
MADKPSRGLADIIAASTAPGDIDGRVVLLEQHAGDRLIRPGSEHLGDRVLSRTPLDRR